MGWWASLGAGGQAAVAGAAVSAGAGLLSGWTAGSEAKKAREWQYETMRKVARKGPTWNVQGLQAAGLNPILAADGGAGGVTPMGTPPMPNFDEATRQIGKSASNAVDIMLMRKQGALLDAQRDKTIAEGKSASAKALVDQIDANFYARKIPGDFGAEGDPQRHRFLTGQIEQIGANIEASRSGAQLNVARQLLTEAQRDMTADQRAKLQTEIKYMGSEAFEAALESGDLKKIAALLARIWAGSVR